MKITNKFNLPETFVNVLKRPTYSKGKANLSVTELINSPRVVALKHQHWEDVEQDASEMVWSLFGSAVHGILEHGRGENHIVEQRLTTEFEGWTLSGAIDLQEVEEDGVIISDYKVTSAWSVMNEKQDWVNQLNLYAWLVQKIKHMYVKRIQIVAIVRDWSARDAKTRDGYPQAPVVVLEMPQWTWEQKEAFVRQRLKLHNDAYWAMAAQQELPACSSTDMWERPSTWAVKKEGATRAKNVLPTLEEAQSILDQMPDKKGYSIDFRPGERVRCMNYCPVSAYCTQHQSYLKEKQ